MFSSTPASTTARIPSIRVNDKYLLDESRQMQKAWPLLQVFMQAKRGSPSLWLYTLWWSIGSAGELTFGRFSFSTSWLFFPRRGLLLLINQHFHVVAAVCGNNYVTNPSASSPQNVWNIYQPDTNLSGATISELETFLAPFEMLMASTYSFSFFIGNRLFRIETTGYELLQRGYFSQEINILNGASNFTIRFTS